MIKLKDYLNAAIALMIVVTLSVIAAFIFKLTETGNVSYFLQNEANGFKIGTIICVVVLAILYIVKLVLFLKGKEEK